MDLTIEQLRARIAAIESGAAGASHEAQENSFTPERAMRKIERLASMREQASSALRVRLVRDGFPAEVADAAVARACACGLVDDARYADVLVRSRLAQGKGVAGIERELADLGIDAHGIEELAVADDHDAELARALALLDRKPPRAKNQREGAYRRLMQKGYSSSVASSAARQWAEAQQ